MAGKKTNNKKPLERVKRQKCSLKGCRKYRTEGSVFCKVHLESEDPTAHVSKLSELDRLKFVEVDQTLINHSQEIRILQQDQKIDDTDYITRKKVRGNRVAELNGAIRLHTLEQRALLEKLGEIYSFDPKRTSIDDRTGVIQEHPLNE